MAKPKNSFEDLARDAAKRIEDARDLNDQLTFLPDVSEAAEPGEGKAVGRPKGAQNKGSSQMREWLAANGHQMPEDMLAQMAGLNSRDPAIVQAMNQTEQVLAWAFQNAKWQGGKKDGQRMLPTPTQKVELFKSLYTILLRASEALLPYGTPKASPDVQVNQQTTVIMPAMPSQPGADARVVEGKVAHRMVPADVADEMQQKQGVTRSDADNPESEIRTDEVKP
ncbi:hypothetical protein KX928_23275 [Roseobacter sp. YSTF-M11]|uniref:Uncharacterized protein n=1 Tax=Roseobacter insulae TaxID=2859783 RepID=A0A9X1FZY6_9RHOB|nr:hypothetical protein [Roseobacter insulae]MBW4710722.1 hypothetical protein [Roseobacter insulae]